MAERVVDVCDRCGDDIVYDPSLGDENAGEVETKYPGYTIVEKLDIKCMRKQLAMHRDRRPANYKGTAIGADKLYALPHKETPPSGGGGVKPAQPHFRG